LLAAISTTGWRTETFGAIFRGSMAEDLIRYDLLAQDALRGLVKKVLSDVSRFGLPGEHHLYISFDTRAPGVRLSQRLREKYPEEMTVILQHQFWDLAVTEHAFEVGLSFGNAPERLLVPFSAIKGFFDPSVQFGLQFDVKADAPQGGEAEPAAGPAVATAERRPTKGARSEPAETLPAVPKSLPRRTDLVPATKQEGGQENAPPAGKPAAEVVSLDAFRKK